MCWKTKDNRKKKEGISCAYWSCWKWLKGDLCCGRWGGITITVWFIALRVLWEGALGGGGGGLCCVAAVRRSQIPGALDAHRVSAKTRTGARLGAGDYRDTQTTLSWAICIICYVFSRRELCTHCVSNVTFVARPSSFWSLEVCNCEKFQHQVSQYMQCSFFLAFWHELKSHLILLWLGGKHELFPVFILNNWPD